MKVQIFDILFDDTETNPHTVYHSGQTVVFKVHLKLLEPIKCTKLTVTLLGKSKVKWTEQKSKSSSKTYQSEELYIDHTVAVFIPDSYGPNEGKHPAGEFYYPLGFQLPATAPSSFEGRYGSIRYSIKASIDRPWKLDNFAQKYFTVVQDLDLNAKPEDEIGPYRSTEEAKVQLCACIGCGYGKVRVDAAVIKRGFVPGEQLHVTGEVVNSSRSDLEIVLMEIYQLIQEEAEGRMQTTERIASSAQLPALKRGQSLRLNHLLPVPAVPGSFLTGCNNIAMYYFFRIRAGDGCCVSFKQDVCQLIIGTLPLQSYLMITIVSNPTDQSPQAQPDQPELAVGAVDVQPAAAVEYVPPASGARRQHYAECAFGRVSMERAEGICHCFQDSWAPSYPIMTQPQPHQMPHWEAMRQQQRQQQLQESDDVQLQPLLHSQNQ